jgi:hypothetical protein
VPWRGPREPGEFPTLGYAIAEWAEATLRIPDGPRVGRPWRYTDDQLRHLLHSYRLHAEAPGDAATAAAMRYRGDQWIAPQKAGKDPVLATRCLAHAFGPVEFAGWDAAGEPVGRPHPSPWVAVAALNDEQTDNTWLPIQVMVRNSVLVDLPGVQVNLDEVLLPGGAKMEPLSTTAMGRLGGRFTFVGLTESGLMVGTGRRGGVAFGRTLKRNVAGMGGSWAEVTNPWDPTEESLAQQQHEAVERGHVDDVWVTFRKSRRRVPLDDDAAVLDELEYLYGDASTRRGGWVVCERIRGEVQDPSSGEAEVRRFFLQEITAGTRPLVQPSVWAAAGRGPEHHEHDPLVPGDLVALGFDGSRSRDATALWALRLRDRRLHALGLWVPAEHGGRVPRPDVDAAVRAAFEAYDVAMLYADPYRWQDYLDTWAAVWGKRVVEFPTTVETRMDAAIERFRTALATGELTHDGDPRLTRHVADTALAKGKRKPPRDGDDLDGPAPVEHYLRAVKRRDGVLIDASIAAILAVAAGGQAIEQGALVGDRDRVVLEGSLMA